MSTLYPNVFISPSNFENKLFTFNLSAFNLSSYELKYIYRMQSIRQVLPWLIFSFGLIGNLFIFLIFISKKTRGFSSNAFCFCALAIADIFALIFMVLRSMLKLYILSDLTISCKLIKFIYHVSLQLSSWCLVLLTIDRLIAVAFIFKYKFWCKKYIVVKILIGIFVGIILLNFHLLIFTESRMKKDDIFDITTRRMITGKVKTTKPTFKPKYSCSVDQDRFPIYSKYFFNKWDIYHAILYGGLPFIIILSCNLFILLKLTLLKNSKILKTRVNKSESTRSLDKIDKSIKSFQITVMLLSVAFIFLLFTSPISIYMAIFYPNLTKMKLVKKEYIKVVLRYIGYINNAINFYVYIILSSEFRKQFIDLLCKCYKFKPISSTVSKCTTSTSLESLNKPELKPLPPITKPIVRKGLTFKKSEENLLEDSNTPFIKQNDAVERFKHKTKTKQLFYYKNGNDLSSAPKQSSDSEEIFINSRSTYV